MFPSALRHVLKPVTGSNVPSFLQALLKPWDQTNVFVVWIWTCNSNRRHRAL